MSVYSYYLRSVANFTFWRLSLDRGRLPTHGDSGQEEPDQPKGNSDQNPLGHCKHKIDQREIGALSLVFQTCVEQVKVNVTVKHGKGTRKVTGHHNDRRDPDHHHQGIPNRRPAHQSLKRHDKRAEYKEQNGALLREANEEQRIELQRVQKFDPTQHEIHRKEHQRGSPDRHAVDQEEDRGKALGRGRAGGHEQRL